MHVCACVCLCVHVCVCMCVYGQCDRCWTATMMDFNACRAALPVGWWQDKIEMCSRPGKANIDEDKGARNVTVVHGSIKKYSMYRRPF